MKSRNQSLLITVDNFLRLSRRLEAGERSNMKQTILSYEEYREHLEGYAIEGLKFLQANIGCTDIDAYEFSVCFERNSEPVTFIEGSVKDDTRRVLLYETRMMEIDDRGVIYTLETMNGKGEMQRFCDIMKVMEEQNPGFTFEWVPYDPKRHYKKDEPLK